MTMELVSFAAVPKQVDSDAMTSNIEEQLKQLQELRQKNLITEEDYKNAKKEALRKFTK